MVNTAPLESYAECISIWKLLTREFAGVHIAEQDGLAVRWADNPFTFWNAVFLTEAVDSVERLRKKLRAAAALRRTKREAGFLLVAEDQLALMRGDVQNVTAQEGFAFALHFTGMAADAAALHANPAPVQLNKRRVTDDEALTAYARLNCEAYGMPASIAPSALTPVWKKSGYSYLGYKNGELVSTAAAFAHEGSLYVGLVATRADFRKQGCAEAMLRHAVAEARRATGINRTTLHATDAGFPTYRRIGYEPTARILVYQIPA